MESGDGLALACAHVRRGNIGTELNGTASTGYNRR